MKKNWKLACTVIMIAVVGLFWACGEDGPASPTSSIDTLPSATPQVSSSTSGTPANPTVNPTYTDIPDIKPKRGNNPFGSGYACEDYPIGIESVWRKDKQGRISKWTIWTVNNTTDQRWRVSGKVYGEKEPGCGRTTKGRKGADDILIIEDPEWIEVGETRDVRWRIDMSAMYNEDYLCGLFQFGAGLKPETHGEFWNHTDRVINTGSDECEPPPSDECKKTEDPSRKGWECEWLGDEICKWGCKCVPTEKPECPELIWNYESCSYVGGCLTCVDVTLDASVTVDENDVAHADATGSGATSYTFMRHNMGSQQGISMPWSEDFQLSCEQSYVAHFRAFDGQEPCGEKIISESAGDCEQCDTCIDSTESLQCVFNTQINQVMCEANVSHQGTLTMTQGGDITQGSFTGAGTFFSPGLECGGEDVFVEVINHDDSCSGEPVICGNDTATVQVPDCCEPVRHTSSPLNYSSTGWAGWSCPVDTHAVGGGVTGNTYPMGAQGIAQPGATIGGHTYPVFPHWTFGPGETG